MARGDPKNLIEALYQKLFGTKTPSKVRKRYFTFVAIVLFILGSLAGVFIQHNFKVFFIDKPDVHVSVGFINKDSIGYYMPIQIINSGQKVLHDVEFEIKTCYMDKPNYEIYDAIHPTSHENYQLRDRTTFREIQKKWCYPDLNFSFANCEVDAYIFNSTDLYIPPQTCSVYLCDSCPFESKISATELKAPRVFSDTIFSPRKIDLKIIPEKQLDIDVSKLKPFPSGFGFNFFTGKEICILEGNCSISKVSDDSILYYLPKLPIEMTLHPKRYNSINMSIFYDNYGQIIKEEVNRGRANISIICNTKNPKNCPKEIPFDEITQGKLVVKTQ